MHQYVQQPENEQEKLRYEKPTLGAVKLFADMVLDNECKFGDDTGPACSNPSYML